jgi:hypothetical protein
LGLDLDEEREEQDKTRTRTRSLKAVSKRYLSRPSLLRGDLLATRGVKDPMVWVAYQGYCDRHKL